MLLDAKCGKCIFSHELYVTYKNIGRFRGRFFVRPIKRFSEASAEMGSATYFSQLKYVCDYVHADANWWLPSLHVVRGGGGGGGGSF